MNNFSHQPMAAKDVKTKALGLVEELKKLAPLADKQRRVPDESIELLKKSGLLRTLQPKEFGGDELTIRAHVDAVSTVARGCGATAWVLGVYHAHHWIMGHMSNQACTDVYGPGRDQAIAAVIGPRGKAIRKADGTYILNGFWPFGSGNAASEWLLLGCEVFDEAGDKLDEGDLLLPVTDAEILDDWFVAGLQGTGSSSIKCSDVIIPSHRFVSLPDVMERKSEVYTNPNSPTLYKSQAGSVLTLCIASSSTGVARSALEEFMRMVPGKKIMYTDHISDEWVTIQKTLGEAAEMIHAAELVIYRAADDIDDYASRGEAMPMELRGRIRMDIAYSVRLSRDAVNLLYTNGGAAGLSTRSTIQRAARDLQAANMHGLLLQDSAAEIFGRVLFGKEPGTKVI